MLNRTVIHSVSDPFLFDADPDLSKNRENTKIVYIFFYIKNIMLQYMICFAIYEPII